MPEIDWTTLGQFGGFLAALLVIVAPLIRYAQRNTSKMMDQTQRNVRELFELAASKDTASREERAEILAGHREDMAKVTRGLVRIDRRVRGIAKEVRELRRESVDSEDIIIEQPVPEFAVTCAVHGRARHTWDRDHWVCDRCAA